MELAIWVLIAVVVIGIVVIVNWIENVVRAQQFTNRILQDIGEKLPSPPPSDSPYK